MRIPIMIPTDLQRNGQYLTTFKGVLPRIPNEISRSFPNVGMSFQLKQNPHQEGLSICPRLPVEQGEGVRKIKDACPRSILALNGSAPQPHPWLTPIRGWSADAPHGKDADDSAAAIQPAAPGSQQLLPDSEGSTADGARPDPGAHHLPRVREPAGASVYLSHLPMARGGQAATALSAYLQPPSPAELTAAADGCFPRYYNNQQATALSEPLRRRPPPGAKNARLQARTNVVNAEQRGLRARSQQKNLDVFFRFFPPPLKD